MDKRAIEKMDLVNDIDRLFYDIENIEDQASVFRAILRLNERSILKGVKAYIKDKSYINEFNQYYKDKEFIPKTEEAEWGLRMVRKMKEIIAHFGNKNLDLIFIIENPRGLLRKMPEMKIYNFTRKTVWYCQYHSELDEIKRAKPTDIWTNAYDWIPRAVCKNGNPNCDHERAPRGSQTGTQGLKGNYERSKVPSELCREILRSIIDEPSK